MTGSAGLLWCFCSLVGGGQDESALRQGGDWLLANGRADGLFRYGFEPALDRDIDEENLVRQAGTATALARVGSILDDRAMIDRAREVIQKLLARRSDRQQESASVRRRFEKKQGAHPVGWSALLLLALAELDKRTDLERTQGDELAGFLLACQRPDGSIRLQAIDDEDADEGDVDEEGWAYYPGEALFALARWGAIRQDARYWESVRKSRTVYTRLWRQEKEPAFVPWQSAAHAELFLAHGDPASSAFVFEMNDWLLELQFDGETSPAGWKGGFGHYQAGQRWAVEPNISTASYAEALVEAVRVAHQAGDVRRVERYRRALDEALAFVSSLQYQPDRLGHFHDTYRNKLAGAFFEAPFDGTVRIDFTQHALMAMGGRERLSRTSESARMGTGSNPAGRTKRR
ncbi:hypothetical protein K2X85_11495 [bacterium]|nr:hypothetical protein [bacterium]